MKSQSRPREIVDVGEADDTLKTKIEVTAIGAVRHEDHSNLRESRCPQEGRQSDDEMIIIAV